MKKRLAAENFSTTYFSLKERTQRTTEKTLQIKNNAKKVILGTTTSWGEKMMSVWWAMEMKKK